MVTSRGGNTEQVEIIRALDTDRATLTRTMERLGINPDARAKELGEILRKLAATLNRPDADGTSG